MATNQKHLFTSESVTEGHPDKIADQISDAVLDAVLTDDPTGRVACEVLVTTGTCIVAGEITTKTYVDVPRIARGTIEYVGYNDATYGFDSNTCGVHNLIQSQSPDISMGVDTGGAGDQGMMFGFACDETPELMPLPIMMAHKLVRRLSEARREGVLNFLRPDGKSQVSVEYVDNKPVRIEAVVISTQHSDDISIDDLRRDVKKHIIDAGLLAAGDLDWMSNVDDTRPDSAGPIQARQLLYQRATSMPVESMLIGNIHAELPTIQESFATAIGSAPLLLGDLRKLSPVDRQWYGEKIGWFKKLRRKTRISESFFPLGSWRQTSSDQWDGFARLAHSGDGVVALFRNKSAAATASVQIPVMAPGKFKLRSVLTGKDIGVFTQADFGRGIPVELGVPVEVLEVVSVG